MHGEFPPAYHSNFRSPDGGTVWKLPFWGIFANLPPHLPPPAYVWVRSGSSYMAIGRVSFGPARTCKLQVRTTGAKPCILSECGFALLCYATNVSTYIHMLCCALLCYALLCHAMLCFAMLCFALLYYAMHTAVHN